MLTFKEFVEVCGKNAGYRKGEIQEVARVGPYRLKHPESLRIWEIKTIRDTLKIPERDLEKYVLEMLRDGVE